MKLRNLALAAALALPGLASAQFIANVTVEPAQLKPGETAKITVNFDLAGSKAANCGLRLHYGDGTTQDFKINQAKDVPLVTTRAWNAPGDFRVMAEGKSQGITLGCGGKNQEFFVKVAAPAAAAKPAAAKPAAASAPAPRCPDGWMLDAKSVNRKTGAYTCTAKSGTKPPAAKLECPGDTGYFENTKRGQLGCRL